MKITYHYDKQISRNEIVLLTHPKNKNLCDHIDYSAQVDQSFRLSWPTIPMNLINNEIPILVKSGFFFYRLLIDLSPSIFIVCDFGIILSIIASANAPPPSLLCHPPTLNCEHNIVECILYLFSNTSNISWCSMLLVLTNSHSSRIRRLHFSYCLILFLYVPCILDNSNLDNKSGSRIYVYIGWREPLCLLYDSHHQTAS